ncbi:MAG: 2-C-methyl-D-erythritol 2,4-cyclodiphosphate synthase [Hyphomicrobiales bacterium]
MKIKVGMGYDVHKFCEDKDLVLGGVNIPYAFGLKAHSDGDVLIHAICDALLGAANMRDIGYHFPDNSDTYKDIDSKDLLSKVVSLIEVKDWNISNIDVTVALQLPKLSPYIDKMKEVLAKVLKIDIEDISIKATTTEKLGFEGRKEGVSAYAVALIIRD